ncbi:LPS translocon maturation chaperone LptM [Kordiimonas lipolytica]
MRKILTISMILLVASSLGACGKKGDVKPPAGYSSTSN